MSNTSTMSGTSAISGTSSNTAFITPQELFNHWQGHRRLTRKILAAFPDDKFESYSIGGMRTPLELAKELVTLGAPGIRGIVTGEWPNYGDVGQGLNSKADVLRRWDEDTAELEVIWPQITAERWREQVKVFNQYEDVAWSSVFYFITNEIHHRGQLYVYLRSLGIEPAPFWDRS